MGSDASFYSITGYNPGYIPAPFLASTDLRAHLRKTLDRSTLTAPRRQSEGAR
ncbi:hypothetical protein GCM10027570_41460 [Streptomonospora sediminis]